jgi:hypothetical protein
VLEEPVHPLAAALALPVASGGSSGGGAASAPALLSALLANATLAAGAPAALAAAATLLAGDRAMPSLAAQLAAEELAGRGGAPTLTLPWAGRYRFRLSIDDGCGAAERELVINAGCVDVPGAGAAAAPAPLALDVRFAAAGAAPPLSGFLGAAAAAPAARTRPETDAAGRFLLPFAAFGGDVVFPVDIEASVPSAASGAAADAAAAGACAGASSAAGSDFVWAWADSRGELLGLTGSGPASRRLLEDAAHRAAAAAAEESLPGGGAAHGRRTLPLPAHAAPALAHAHDATRALAAAAPA